MVLRVFNNFGGTFFDAALIIINYLLKSLIVFTFSLFSLQNDKVYDLLWIKYVQQNLYLKAGINNMFQLNK